MIFPSWIARCFNNIYWIVIHSPLHLFFCSPTFYYEILQRKLKGSHTMKMLPFVCAPPRPLTLSPHYLKVNCSHFSMHFLMRTFYHITITPQSHLEKWTIILQYDLIYNSYSKFLVYSMYFVYPITLNVKITYFLPN